MDRIACKLTRRKTLVIDLEQQCKIISLTEKMLN